MVVLEILQAEWNRRKKPNISTDIRELRQNSRNGLTILIFSKTLSFTRVRLELLE